MNVTVSQLNSYVRQALSMDVLLNDITVSGEISGVTLHSSGHIYFTLKDESAAIRCAFFKPHTLSLKFKPENGMKVLARGQVTLYERDGTYQLKVFSLEEDGQGRLYKEFELLKKKLEAEGLFDKSHKKPIPAFAKKIGVATSPTGAVIRDIINVTTRRCPVMSIVLAPVTVQGDDAPRSVCAGIRALEKMDDVDVIIVGRGGGSMEDLWCFNNEMLARTIFDCKKPIISAVGHETDFTIADFVADLRAPTPSAAAELAVFDYYDIMQDISHYSTCLESFISGKISDFNMRLLEAADIFRDPTNLIDIKKEQLDKLYEKMISLEEARMTDGESRLGIFAGKLDALSPLKVLERGYSVVKDEKGIVKSVKKLSEGERIHVRFTDGTADAEVKRIEKY